MPVLMVLRTSILLTVGLAILRLVGIVTVPWWWLLWPFWLAIPLYLAFAAVLVILTAIAMGRR